MFNLQLSGKKANFNGKQFEQRVEGVFKYCLGFITLTQPQWNQMKCGPNLNDYHGFLIKNYSYTKANGVKGRMEFLALSKLYNLQARIECRSQQNRGSVDEKFLDLYLSAISKKYELNHTIIIIDGAGVGKKPLNFLKDCAIHKYYADSVLNDFNKEVDVFNFTEFLNWANDVRSHRDYKKDEVSLWPLVLQNSLF